MIRGATLISMAVGALVAVFVFALKYEVQDLENEYERLSRSIDRERQAIHVLTAEWSHLNEPSRLRTLAREQLDLDAITPDRFGGADRLPPPRNGNEMIDQGEIEKVADAHPAFPHDSEQSPERKVLVEASTDNGFARIQKTLNALSERGLPE